jgi:metal-sulfur cluster biosynthetic enzyme
VDRHEQATMMNGSDDGSSALSLEATVADQELDPVVQDVIEALDTVPDPCCILSGKNLSILDLGLINRIERQGQTVTIGITLTDTMCEFAQNIFADIEALADDIPNVASVVVVPEVLPIWSTDRLTEHAVRMIKDDSGRFFRNWDLEKLGAGTSK